MRSIIPPLQPVRSKQVKTREYKDARGKKRRTGGPNSKPLKIKQREEEDKAKGSISTTQGRRRTRGERIERHIGNGPKKHEKIT